MPGFRRTKEFLLFGGGGGLIFRAGIRVEKTTRNDAKSGRRRQLGSDGISSETRWEWQPERGRSFLAAGRWGPKWSERSLGRSAWLAPRLEEKSNRSKAYRRDCAAVQRVSFAATVSGT